MDLADGGQILFTKEAHDQIVDMVDDPDPDSMLQIVENMGNALAAFQREIEAKRFIESDQQTNVVIDSRI